ncbi:MAG TPA: XdhC family protein, partial [Candidatus Baltobacteraceae bacterium]|nr:XdhC family protein [Candidatus Baltobacteraceae bacterium]
PRFVRITPDMQAPAPENVVLAPMTCSSGGTIDVWIEPFLPSPVLLVVGASPVAVALQSLGAALGFRVVPYGPLSGDPLAGAEAVVAALRAKIQSPARETWLVAVSHGEFDDELVEAGIRLGYRYVGLIASERRAAATRVRLHQHGLDDAALGGFHPSAGLRIGAKTPEEIALAVMAEIVALRRTQAPLPAPEREAELLDPVCNMPVERGSAHQAEYEGRRYYFCCAGCRRAFEAEPAAYAPAVSNAWR